MRIMLLLLMLMEMCIDCLEFLHTSQVPLASLPLATSHNMLSQLSYIQVELLGMQLRNNSTPKTPVFLSSPTTATGQTDGGEVWFSPSQHRHTTSHSGLFVLFFCPDCPKRKESRSSSPDLSILLWVPSA